MVAPVAELLAILLLASQAPTVRAQPFEEIGVGVIPVVGPANVSFSLVDSGTYCLAGATDDNTTGVDAGLYLNGTLLAQEDTSAGSLRTVSLPAGNYTLTLAGRGRVALGVDFSNGSARNFPVGRRLVACLFPSGPRIHVTVAMGDAQRLAFELYDARLLPVANATVTADQTVTVDLPPDHASAAFLTVTVQVGTPTGLYGLSWSSEPSSAAPNFFAWPLLLLWIVIPVAVAAGIYLIVRERRGRPRG